VQPLRGASNNDGFLDGRPRSTPVTPFNPGHPCGESKVLAERDIAELADDSFSSSYLRTATAYRVSPRLRGDVVINNLAEWRLPPARCI
jgi:hypothetical protein